MGTRAIPTHFLVAKTSDAMAHSFTDMRNATLNHSRPSTAEPPAAVPRGHTRKGNPLPIRISSDLRIRATKYAEQRGLSLGSAICVLAFAQLDHLDKEEKLAIAS